MNGDGKKKIEDALFKRAVGYDSVETVEEFSEDGEGETRLLKRKVITKNVPPDISAAKILLGLDGEEFACVGNMTDDELIAERQKLLDVIRQSVCQNCSEGQIGGEGKREGQGTGGDDEWGGEGGFLEEEGISEQEKSSKSIKKKGNKPQKN